MDLNRCGIGEGDGTRNVPEAFEAFWKKYGMCVCYLYIHVVYPRYMNGITTRKHEILNKMYNIIRMKKEVDRWQALNELSIEWMGEEEWIVIVYGVEAKEDMELIVRVKKNDVLWWL